MIRRSSAGLLPIASMIAMLSLVVTTLTGCYPAPTFEDAAKAIAQRPELKPKSTMKAGEIDVNAILKHDLPRQPGPYTLREVKDRDGDVYEAWVARGEVGKPGGSMTVSTFGSDPKTYNLWAASDVTSHGLGLLLFEPLCMTDPWSGKTIPRLAKSVEVSDDKTEYTIKLRKGLKWSDGKPLTADDVMFTFGKIVAGGYGNSSLRDTMSVEGKFPKISKVDDLTVKFKTAKPFAPLLGSFTGIGIAPKHVMQAQTDKPVDDFPEFWDINADTKGIVCCGPFKPKRFMAGERVELERNPYYHFVDKQGRQLPYLEKFIVLVVPDQNTMILKFYGNEVDLLDVRAVRGFDVALMKQREQKGAFKMYNLGPDDGTLFLFFNLARRTDPKTKKPYLSPVKQEWFNNRLFRQAINHSINRARIVRNVLRGVGMPLYTAETPASLFYNASLQGFPQDLEKSAKLLAEAGFVKKNGILYDQAGNRVEFVLETNAGNMTRDAVCIIIKEDLEKLGIKVNYRAIDFNILIGKVENTLDFEAIVMGLSGSRLEPYGGANVWKSDGRLHMFDQRLPNAKGTVEVPDARDWEKRIDKLFDLGAVTLDEKERKKIFDEFQKIAFEEVPYIYLYCPLLVTAAHERVGNYKPTPYGINYTPLGTLHNIEEIYKKD